MALNTNIYVPVGFNNSGVQFTDADTTALKTIFTADASNGSDVRSIIVTSTDTAIRYMRLYQTISSVDYLLGETIIPATAGAKGDGTVATVDLLACIKSFLKLDNAGNRVLSLAPGNLLKASLVATMTTAKVIQVVTHGVNY